MKSTRRKSGTIISKQNNACMFKLLCTLLSGKKRMRLITYSFYLLIFFVLIVHKVFMMKSEYIS